MSMESGAKNNKWILTFWEEHRFQTSHHTKHETNTKTENVSGKSHNTENHSHNLLTFLTDAIWKCNNTFSGYQPSRVFGRLVNKCFGNHFCSRQQGTEKVVETLVYSPSIHLTWHLARESFIQFSHRESFVSYATCIWPTEIETRCDSLYSYFRQELFVNISDTIKIFVLRGKKLLLFNICF
jgi:hypothetical protein